ncbi:hypothetical protein [Glutamicibacter arilaitensis]|uniref:hypothetical protein n=1 Tax=Glutamicibacter arilaitensis TaxID=256701 RepID=UPI003850DBB7
MKGQQVLDSNHDLWQVEASFRMTKSDLSAPPVFYRDEDAIDAHLTVVFAALAIGRYLQELTGRSLKRIITDLKGVCSAKIQVNGDYVVIPAEVSAELREQLAKRERGVRVLTKALARNRWYVGYFHKTNLTHEPGQYGLNTVKF